MTSRAGASLRSINYRLSTASPKQLLHQIHPIASTLIDCKSLFSSASGQASSKDSTDAVVLHKFKTQLSSLLNGKTPEARCAGVVLLKTIIEIGGWETLQACGPWVRALLTILGKPDPSSVKKLVVMTLTRIFLFTQEYPTLIREITTPSLPAFVTACLNILAPKTLDGIVQTTQGQGQLLQPVLKSFQQLLPHHPNIFRSYLTQLRDLLLPLIAPTPSHMSSSSSTGPSIQGSASLAVSYAAQQLFPLLSISAPKSTSGAEWLTSFNAIILDAHSTANLTFRSVIEDYTSLAGAPPPPQPQQNNNDKAYSDVVAQHQPSAGLSLPPWSGIHAGAERLHGLFDLLSAYMTQQTSAPVAFPLGRIFDLLLRIMAVGVPSGGTDTGLRPNSQIPRDERESLYAALPSIHTAAIKTIHTLLERFGATALPVVQQLTEYIIWTFRHESFNEELRTQCYHTIALVLELTGGGMTKEQVQGLDKVLRAVCEDILPPSDDTKSITANNTSSTGATGKNDKNQSKKQNNINADTFLNPNASKSNTTISSSVQSNATPLYTAATTLLTTALLKLPSQNIPHSLRATLDRTAVLSQHQPAMLASTLNPPSTGDLAKINSSLLPLLARTAGHGNGGTTGEMAAEGVLRPRVPVLQTKFDDEEGGGEDSEEEAEDDLMQTWEGEEDQVNGGLNSAEVDAEGNREAAAESAATTSAPLPFATITTTTPAAPPPSNAAPAPVPAPAPAAQLTHPTHETTTTATGTSNHLKRPAADTLPPTTTLSPKRAKMAADLNGEVLPPGEYTNPRAGKSTAPLLLTAEQESGGRPAEKTAAVPVQTAVVPFQMAGGATKAAGDDDDDSDFEMPPLTMEQDTEDEDEDEGEEDQDIEGVAGDLEQVEGDIAYTVEDEQEEPDELDQP